MSASAGLAMWVGVAEDRAATCHRLNQLRTGKSSPRVSLLSKSAGQPGLTARSAWECEPYHARITLARGLRALTCRRAVSRLRGFSNREEEFLREADISTECASPEEDSRLPRANEDAGRAEGAQTAARERAQAPHRVVSVTRRRGAALSLPHHERLRHAGDIQAVFQEGKREEQPGFVLLWRVGDGGPKAGFAVSRQVRGAVSRNRARRRLREAYRRYGSTLPDKVNMVFVARPAALSRDFGELMGDMRRAIGAVARAARGGP
jgi:ribonuclease P protein component